MPPNPPRIKPPRLKGAKLTLLGVARTQLRQTRGIDEDAWRDILEAHGGVRSARELDQRGFEAVLDHLARLGWVSTGRRETYGERVGFASPGQIALIRSLWKEAMEHPKGKGLTTFLERQAGVSSLRFLPADKASKVITVLKAMKTRREDHSRSPAPKTPASA